MAMLNEELDYVSSSPLLVEAETPKFQDETDEPALKRIQTILGEQIKSYDSIQRLALDDKSLSVEQQLAVNRAIVIHLQEIKLLVDTTLTSIKEKYGNG